MLWEYCGIDSRFGHEYKGSHIHLPHELPHGNLFTIVTSMGPRSRERGNTVATAASTLLGFYLQWGRALVSAEMRRSSRRSARRVVMLQWGRALVSAEMIALYLWKCSCGDA